MYELDISVVVVTQREKLFMVDKHILDNSRREPKYKS